MQSCNLNIVLHSAKDLQDVRLLGIMSPYAEVWISGDGMHESKHKTGIARHVGCAPVWEYSIDFKNVLMKKSDILFIDIKHDGKLHDRNIGQVQIPFKDLLAGDAAGDKVSYRVMIPSGNQTQGEIILSHRFTGVDTPISTGNARPKKATTAAPKKATSTAASNGKATTAASGKATTSGAGNATASGTGIAATLALGIAGIVASSVIGGVTESLVTGLMSGVTNEEEDYPTPVVVEEEEEEEEEVVDDEEEEEYEEEEEEDEY